MHNEVSAADAGFSPSVFRDRRPAPLTFFVMRKALRMADGKEYPVPHRDYISIQPRGLYVLVYDDQGRFTVVPLLTMRGLHSIVPGAGAKGQ